MEDVLEATVQFNKNLANTRLRLLQYFKRQEISLARKRPLLPTSKELANWHIEYIADQPNDVGPIRRRGRRPKDMEILDPNEKTFVCPGCNRLLPLSRKYARE
jgi:hypothetical protein